MVHTLEYSPLRLPPLWLLSFLPALGLFTAAIHTTCIPAITEEFQVAAGPVQQVVAAYLVAAAVFALLAGPASDRIGRRPVALLTLAIFVAGSALALIASDPRLLLWACLLQGAGASGGIVLSRSMVKDVLSGQPAARASAQVATAVAVAPMLAPTFAGFIQQLAGWRANYVVVLALSASLLLIAWLRLVETLPPARRNTAGIWSTLKACMRLLGLRRFQVHTMPVMCGTAGFYSFQTGAPVLLVAVMHATPAEYGLYAAAPAFGFMIGTFAASRVALRIREGAVIGAGCLMLPISGLLMAILAGSTAPSPWLLVLPMLLFGVGNGILTPAATVGSLSAAPSMVGAAAALLGCLRMGASGLGSYVISILPSESATALGIVLTSFGLLAVLIWNCIRA
jgi:MFS transporter, DHA1 family, multidrug resistance protein